MEQKELENDLPVAPELERESPEIAPKLHHQEKNGCGTGEVGTGGSLQTGNGRQTSHKNSAKTGNGSKSSATFAASKAEVPLEDLEEEFKSEPEGGIAPQTTAAIPG